MRETRRRSIKHQTGENAVQMRVHRRSIEQKSRRDEMFLKGRKGLDLNPVVEEPEVIEKVASVKDKDVRREMLQRWKEEKKLKAKLTAEKIGKPFKITKINHSAPIFLFSEKQVNGQPITAGAASAMNASMRVTRSKTNMVIQPTAQPLKRAPTARTLKAAKPQPEPAGPVKKGSRTAKGTVKPAVRNPQPCETAASSSATSNAEVVRSKREPSFAPMQFAFTAPTGISPFFFQTKTIGVEKLLPQLAVVSNVSPVLSGSQSAIQDNSRKPDDSVPMTDNEAVFKTPRSTIAKIKPYKISPLLENNPWICTYRGKPPSSEKSTPRRSRISKASSPLSAIQIDFQPMECEDSVPAPVNTSVAVVENMESRISPSVDKSDVPSPPRQLCARTPAKSAGDPTVDQSNVSSPPRQLRARTPANNTVDRSSSGFALTPSYFRDMLKDQTKQLKTLCNNWQAIMESEQEHISENVIGKIRTTIGQSELLMAERFKQFAGLIDDCELGRGEKVTTCVDLQGFWEMIFFQVEDVKTKFEFLEKIKSANWEEIATPIKPAAVVKRIVRRVNPKPEARPKPGAAALAARQRLAEMKAKAKASQLRKVAMDGLQEDQIIVTDANTDLLPSRVQEVVLERQIESNENAFPSDKISTPRPRRSLRSSLQASILAPTENETAILLLPVPVLASLSLNSPVVSRSPKKRLSELYSPLSGGRKGTVQTLATINDDEDSEMVMVEQMDITVQKPYKSVASPHKRITRSSNLMRFSEVFSAPTSPGAIEKEKASFALA